MPFNPLNIPGAVTGIASGLYDAFGGGTNPADAAQPYLDKIPGTINPLYAPYTGAGSRAIPTLEAQYNNLVTDPNALIEKFSASYKPSAGYQFKVGQATDAANRAAAAGGMLGSPAHQYDLANTVQGLAGQDYYDFLKLLLGQYGTGLSGFQDFARQGQSAATNQASQLQQALMSQAGLAYEGQAAQNARRTGGIGQAIGAGASLFNPVPNSGIPYPSF